MGIIVRRNIGGRPIGSTNVNKAAKKKRKLEALNEAATMYSEAKENKISTKHGKLKQIIEKINGKYNLHGDEAIKAETVRTRCKPGRKLHAANPGPVPCIIQMEPLFVETFLKLAEMRQYVTVTEALEFINSTIRNTSMERQVKEWKKKHSKEDEEDDNAKENGFILGKKYWANFLKRNPLLSTKAGNRFDVNREDWCTSANFEKMYDDVYAKMVDARVAIELPDDVWLDAEGKVVEKQEDAIGRKTKYIMTRPNYCVFVDEVGDNTSQKDDGNIGGTKYVVWRKKRALL